METDPNPGSLITRLAHTMACELDRQLRVFGITLSQWSLLKNVWAKEGRSQVELQEILGLEAATVSGLIQRMTAQDLIYRQPDQSDKRVQRVYLTDRGRELKCVMVPLDKVNEHALKGFTADERDFFIRLLTRALHNFEEE